MSYQPTHPHPYLESIDAASELGHTFSVIINPKDVISAYVFNLYKIATETDENGVETTQLVQIYSINKTLPQTEWLYGSEFGAVLNVELPAVVENFDNGSEYQWKIVLNDINGDSVESPLYYFTAKASPVITLDVPDTITTCEYSFSATYSQEQKDTYMYYQYDLYRDGVLIDSTSEKMDSLLSYKYSGFISGNRYRLDLTIMTVDRNIYKLSRSFNVEYSIQPSVLFSTVTAVQNKNCVNVDYSQNLFIKGNSNGDIAFDTFVNEESTSFVGASVPSDVSIYYNKINETKPLTIGEDFTVYYSVHFDEFFSGDIITLTDETTENTYVVRYDGKKFYYKIGYGSEISIDPYVNTNAIHQEESAVQPVGTTTEDLNYNTIYILNDDDIIKNDSVILYNDITSNFWWNFVLLPNKVLVYRGEKYFESEVN